MATRDRLQFVRFPHMGRFPAWNSKSVGRAAQRADREDLPLPRAMRVPDRSAHLRTPDQPAGGCLSALCGLRPAGAASGSGVDRVGTFGRGFESSALPRPVDTLGMTLKQVLIQAAGLLALVLALVALLQPGWGATTWLGLALLLGGLRANLGWGSACLILSFALAVRGSSPGAGVFAGVLLPLYAAVSGGLLLMGLVARYPVLGSQIEHEGPGGL